MIAIDKDRKYKYASLQSEFGKKILDESPFSNREIDSIMVYKNGNYFIKSDAVIEIIKELRWYWRTFLIISVFPKKLRDNIYDRVARNRFKWFGKKKTCRVPTEDEKELFLEKEDGL